MSSLDEPVFRFEFLFVFFNSIFMRLHVACITLREFL